MPSVVETARSGQKAAITAREILSDLFELSNRQADALNRENYEELDLLITKKADLLAALDNIVAGLKERGWELNNPTTYPKDSTIAAALRDAADISRRLQAHERYILGQMIVQRQFVGDRMDRIMQKRLAIAGYQAIRRRGQLIDAAS